jgi:16S rRNA (cytidine1402-2'-O)-methyltransferase
LGLGTIMVTFIPTPIGNLQDITFRAIELFNRAELFLCEDTRKTKQLITLLDKKIATCRTEATFLSFNEHNGSKRLSQIDSKLIDSDVVYVSDAGTPTISDPGTILVEYCQKQNIPYDVLPGSTAVTTAYSASGFEGGRFIFWGFLPHKGLKRERELEEILSNRVESVLYESPYRLLKLLEEICRREPNRLLFLAKELTKKHQKYYKDRAEVLYTLLSNRDIKGEWVVVVEKSRDRESNLSILEIENMDIPPKVKAKILAKLTKTPVKEWYDRLISSKT